MGILAYGLVNGGRIAMSAVKVVLDRTTLARTDVPRIEVQPAYEWLLFEQFPG